MRAKLRLPMFAGAVLFTLGAHAAGIEDILDAAEEAVQESSGDAPVTEPEPASNTLDRPVAVAPQPTKSSGGITKRGDNIYNIDEALWDRYAHNLDRAKSLAQPVHHKNEAGTADGWQMRGIRKNGTMHRAGLHNGDVVHAVNGEPIHTWPLALAAWTRLKNEKAFEVDLTRRDGRRMALHYFIR